MLLCAARLVVVAADTAGDSTAAAAEHMPPPVAVDTPPPVAVDMRPPVVVVGTNLPVVDTVRRQAAPDTAMVNFLKDSGMQIGNVSYI